MKRIILLLIAGLGCGYVQAQTPEEWMNQKSTQTKYLLQQIALFQVYLGYVQKGYSITQGGLSAIGHLKNQERQSHADYFLALEKVNPKIRYSSRVAAILAIQINLMQTWQSAFRELQQNSQLNPVEKDYLTRTLKNLLQENAADSEALVGIISDHHWAMKDDERLQRINALYLTMLDKYAFVQNLMKEAKTLAMQHFQAQKSIQTSRALYGF
ncbi:hypothetical protein [Adhaeribacter rhizoryzae]|uniref:TerB family tellurite resistance protein n=1 Tax=Adhaeribacter rhizoryzae TaxID=2607907 RepID=A0A5M6DKR4_9BACT|nr:hypothetical protein [Adhaeribacter rhizoryzae]KAA5548118.1 hypothetical protein F0145_05160 [Adhaeribacter rhizoryzae]